jgi:hypothetical protein
MSYYEKYLKYKKKYLNLKGGQVFELSIPAVHADDFRELIKSNIELYSMPPYDHVETYQEIVDPSNNNIIFRITKPPMPFQNFYNLTEIILKERWKEITNRKMYQYLKLLRNINKERISEIINFFNTMNPDDLFTYLQENRLVADLDKTIIYLIARQGVFEVMRYLFDRLGEIRIRELLKVKISDGRIPLFAALRAASNKIEMYNFVKYYTDPSLYKIKFLSQGITECNLIDFAILLKLNMNDSPEDTYIYEDVKRITA